MKKGWFFLIALLFIGTGSPVFGQSNRGNRYNPYDPYRRVEKRAAEENRNQELNYLNNDYGANSLQSNQGRVLYERDFLTRSYITEYSKDVEEQYFTNPYGTIPGKWYDSEMRYSGGVYGKTLQTSGVLTNPYGDAYPRQNETNRNQNVPRERASMEGEYSTLPYGTDSRRWYDSQTNYQGGSQKTSEPSRTPSSPYATKDPRFYPSEALTSPFDGAAPQRPSAVSANQELTPPTIR